MIELKFDIILKNDGDSLLDITLIKEDDQDIYVNDKTGSCSLVSSGNPYSATLERDLSEISIDVLRQIFKSGDNILIENDSNIFMGEVDLFINSTPLCPYITINLLKVFNVNNHPITQYMGDTYFLIDESIKRITKI